VTSPTINKQGVTQQQWNTRILTQLQLWPLFLHITG